MTKPIVPLLAAVTAASLTFVPPERGGIRMLQAIWLLIAHDNVLVAAVIHAAVIGGLSFAIFFVARRAGRPIVGNIVGAVVVLAYTLVFFTWGVPMVA